MPQGKPEGELAKLQTAFAAHLRNPEHNAAPAGIEDRRMAIYRELFYNNIERFLANSYPVIRKLHDDKTWHAMVRDFFTRHRATTPMFPELPREFLHYLQDVRGQLESDPPFLLELAHYEWSEIALQLDESEPDPGAASSDDLIQDVPVVSPLAWLLSYRFPVHQIRPEFQPNEAPEQPTYLLLRRTPSGKIRFIELNAASAYLFEQLKANRDRSGLDCLKALAEEMQHPQPDSVISGGEQQMRQWKDLNILLGARKL